MATNASEKTPNLGLSQWAAGDYFLREDFNSDNLILDSAARIAYGTYVGTGSWGGNGSSLSFDFEPKLLVIMNTTESVFLENNGTGVYYNHWLMAVRGASKIGTKSYSSTGYNTFTWDGNTVSWVSDTGVINQMNSTSSTYAYLAIG